MKKVLFTLAIGLATLTSCESDSETTPNNNAVGVLLTKTIDTFDDGSTVTGTYTYDGNKLTEMSFDDGFRDEFTYTNGLLTKIEEYTDDVLDLTTVLEYDSSDRLIKETYTFTGQASDVNTFVYNADGTVTFNEDGGQIYVYSYSGGNNVSEDNTNGDGDYTSTYDSKNGVFKNIHQREVFELLGYYASVNNLLTYTNTSGTGYDDEDETNTYTYNASNYPATSVQTYYAGTIDEETTNTEYFYE